jgi:nucleotide-binding universal stress UspA family protein
MYRHILIPTDGSELAHKAVAHGLSLAKALGARVSVVTVEVPFHVFDAYRNNIDRLSDAMAEHERHAKAHASKVLGVVSDAAKAAGVACETVQADGDQPYAAIIATAKQRGCDLIVMSSHGRGGVSALVLGSETNKVLTHSDIPVLVYR